MRRRFLTAEAPEAEFRSVALSPTMLSLRLQTEPAATRVARGQLIQHYAPQVAARAFSSFDHGAATAPIAGVGVWSNLISGCQFGLDLLSSLSLWRGLNVFLQMGRSFIDSSVSSAYGLAASTLYTDVRRFLL